MRAMLHRIAPESATSHRRNSYRGGDKFSIIWIGMRLMATDDIWERALTRSVSSTIPLFPRKMP